MDKPRFKKKSWIRFEAVVPCTVMTGLVLFYFICLFDLHMKKGLEWMGTQINGAEVNIRILKTSFLKGTLLIQDIQVTQLEMPTQNKIQIGDVQFQFLWDALLRGKFVISLASMHDIQLNSVRKYAGKVLPPSVEKKTENSWFSGFKSQIMEKVQTQIAGSSLANASHLLEGFDPTRGLTDLGELKSKARILELKNQLTQKQTEWASTLSSLSGGKNFSDLQNKLNEIHVGGTSNPAEIANQIHQAKSLVSEVTAQVELVKAKGDFLSQDVNRFSQSVGELDELIQKDRSHLESRLKLPKLDAKNLAGELFGPEILNRIAQAEYYIALARKYMPAKKAVVAVAEEKKTWRGEDLCLWST